MANSLYGNIRGSLPNPKAGKNQKCLFDTCVNLVGNKGARGLCGGHYNQLRTGRELTPLQTRMMNDLAPEGFKTCRNCWEQLPLISFCLNKKNKDGINLYCRTCDSYNKKLRTHGVDQQNFDNMLTDQNGKCLICRDDISEAPKIDHCHSTGRVRGLLCSNCNAGLGMFRDEPEFLMNAILYLKEEL